MRVSRLQLLTGAVMMVLAPVGQAACPDDGATPMNIGAHNPQTTFPLWMQDSEGLALEICPGTDQVNCISVPPFTAADFPGDPDAATKAALSQQIGFGDEGFWASAEAIISPLPVGGGLAILVSAAEAAFLPDFADGNQTQFTRLRIRVDIPVDGTYVITHPWGRLTYNITGATNNRDINDTIDVPFVADQVDYQGVIGPFLTWDTFPDDPLLDQYGPPFRFDPPFGDSGPDGVADYIGSLIATDPATGLPDPVNGVPEHRVKGSPCGTNFFRIDGPPAFGSVQTDLFTVTGKVFNGASLPTPLAINQATYSRSDAGRVNVFATAPTQAVVSFTGSPNLPAGDQTMSGDGSGRFFGTVALTPDATTVPADITVTADNGAVDPDNLPTDRTVPLVDLVTITRAEYDYASGDLTIEAHSSDLASPPTLSALGQALTGGLLTVNTTVAPAAVTVTSSAGGSATLEVTVIHAP